MKVIIVSGLSDAKLYSKISPLLHIDAIEEVILVRRTPLNVQGVTDFVPPRFCRKFRPLADLYRLIDLIRLLIVNPGPKKVVAFYLVPHGLYAWFAGLITRTPVIQVFVGTDLEKALNKRFYAKIIRAAESVCVRGERSRSIVESFTGIQGEQIYTPHNVFDTKLFSPDKRVEKKYDFIYVGNLVEPKQPELLIRSFALVQQEFPEVRMAVVGDGILKKSTQDLATRLKLDQNIAFVNSVPNNQLPQLLNASRTFIMTSRTEGLPMAMIEALSCGVPVIMPDVGEVTSVAEDGLNALIVSKQLPESYAAAMIGLLSDNTMYEKMVAGALKTRDIFKSDYTMEACQKMWISILKPGAVK